MLQSFISLILLTVPSFSWAAPAVAPPTTIQGFDSYTQSAEGIRFSCKKQCFVVLGSLGINDYLSWSGKISGSGSVGYGFLNGQQIIPGEFRPISSGMTMRDRMIFSHNQYYSQIPKEMPIVAVMNGEMEASDFSFILGELTPSEAVTWAWNRFSQTENLAQYSINLLRGYFVWETSLTWILSLLFVIEVLGIVFVYSFNRRRFWIPVLFSGMLFVVLYDLREQVNLSDIRNGYYDHYANISVSEQRDWFGIGYYPDILDRVSQYIKPAFSGQKVYLATQQGFPLFGYAQYRFHPTKTILVEEGKEMELAQKWDIYIRYFSTLAPADGWEQVYASQDGGATLYVKQ